MTSKDLQVGIKYGVDRVVAAVLLVLLSPLLLAICVAIFLDDRGPVLFMQERIGLGQQRFRAFKLRSMIVNADSLLDSKGAVGNQNRITRVGRYLRSWSLDEIPQLINVLRGEMSLVGPRPVLPSHIKRYSPSQCRRFEMKPGITGLAQVSGRNTLKWSRRLELDVQYIDNYKLSDDIRILFKTITVVLSHEGIVLDRNQDQIDDLPEVYQSPVQDAARVAA